MAIGRGKRWRREGPHPALGAPVLDTQHDRPCRNLQKGLMSGISGQKFQGSCGTVRRREEAKAARAKLQKKLRKDN